MIGDESHPLLLRRLPCVVESFKTYDDINLVKTADVGEVAPAQRFAHRARHSACLHTDQVASCLMGTINLVLAQWHTKASLSDAMHFAMLAGLWHPAHRVS